MPSRVSKTGSELFIVDNSDQDWKVLRYLHDWCQLSRQIDIATGYFEIGALIALKDEWQKIDKIRILMGDEVSKRTKNAFVQALEQMGQVLDDSLEAEKEKNDFLTGVPAIVEAFRSGKIECRVYRKDKFHAKAYITHAKLEVVGSSALVGSSNLTFPGLTENIELNVQITGRPVTVLQEWYDEHWALAEEVTEEILRVFERHIREYSPFEVYVRSLQEYFRSHEVDADQWEQHESIMYPVLATYQKKGYHGLLKRANMHRGAFLCDGVGLGKTFIGLMLIERLIRDKKRVALFVPKAARESVWEAKIKKYLPDILGGFLSFRIFNHSDLMRSGKDIQHELDQMRQQADVIIIDEAHHFRNTGIKGENGDRKSRYWRMYDICEGKQVFMLTATPVNNRLTDLQHMMELFTRHQVDYFSAAPLGIHSLAGHIRKLENAIEKAALRREKQAGSDYKDIEDAPISLDEAAEVLRDDSLFQELVVQRSRAYVKKSVAQEDMDVLFPEPCVPEVVPYSVKQTYGKLLKMVEEAFHKNKPLFSLAMYYPWEFYKGDKADLAKQNIALVAGRQKQVVSLIRTSFLKRFESSVMAFESSCRTLMKKLIAFYEVHATTQREKDRLEKWMIRNKAITGYEPGKKQHLLFEDLQAEMVEDDVVESEYFEYAAENKLPPEQFDLHSILEDTNDDLDTIAEFLKELAKFEPKQDKKLRSLINLLEKDKVLSKHKCLIFTEFKDTAHYLEQQLKEAGITGVMEIDSTTNTNDRTDMIKSFSPYYNDTTSEELKKAGLEETRMFISTDVLSEGLNLQDATRLINYDLHWNPVRLMQRIGRIDRRLDPVIERKMIEDHPEVADIRRTIQYYNFLPPEELNELLSLYKRVSHKTLRISKTFGIENGKLLRPDDDYDVLRDFIQKCEGQESQGESLSLEYQRLLKENPGLEERVKSFPNKVFSGKQSPQPDTKAVFFCYARPAQDIKSNQWTIEAGDVRWYLYTLSDEKITDDTHEIVKFIRSEPDTPRVCTMEKQPLGDIRTKLEKHIKDTYFKKVQAPIGVKPALRAWMEIN